MPDTPPLDLSKNEFIVGGEDLLTDLKSRFVPAPLDEPGQVEYAKAWSEFVKNVRIRLGTLLKSENLAFLIGSGASVGAGGVLLGKLPLEIEADLAAAGQLNGQVESWLTVVYYAAHRLDAAAPSTPTAVAARVAGVMDGTVDALAVNLEVLLSLLWRWHGSITDPTETLRLELDPEIAANQEVLNEAVRHVTLALARHCRLPTAGKTISPHRQFLRKILTRPLNLSRVALITTNYDTLIEQAADAEGVFMSDGFVGSLRRVFRPESFGRDLYFPGETTEGPVHRVDRVLQLYKIHGSLTWRATERGFENPYGIEFTPNTDELGDAPLIYPTPAKYAESLGLPYSELFRRFAMAVSRPQTTLFTLGYGFGDEHVNTIIWQALAIPSFTLVVVDPRLPPADATGSSVGQLRLQSDPRVWLVGGDDLALFESFVATVLPNLRDEEIEQRIIRTVRALADPKEAVPAQPDIDLG